MIIKDGNNQVVINRADIEKLSDLVVGENGIIRNKCVLYDQNGSVLRIILLPKREVTLFF